MSTRSLNKVMLIGNLTRDPECRYTPNQTQVCSFGLATNREWVNEGGEKQSNVEFHNLVVWSKLAEICKNLLHKGSKIYVEGRLQTRDWQTKDNQARRTTEIVVENMLLLDKKSDGVGGEGGYAAAEEPINTAATTAEPAADEMATIEDTDDIPF